MATNKRITIGQVHGELDELRVSFKKFVENDFGHLKEEFLGFRKRVDKLIALVVTALISTTLMLLGLVANLILTIAKG